jgi:hypothetical protein
MLCHRSSTLADALSSWSCSLVDASPLFHACSSSAFCGFGMLVVAVAYSLQVVLVFAGMQMLPSSSSWNAHCLSIVWLSSMS